MSSHTESDSKCHHEDECGCAVKCDKQDCIDCKEYSDLTNKLIKQLKLFKKNI